MERGPAVPLRVLHRRSLLNQELRDLLVVPENSEIQRCPPLGVLGVDVHPVMQQLDEAHVALLRREVQTVVALARGRGGVDALLAQQPRDEAGVTVVDGEVERRPALVVTDPDVRSFLNQDLGHLQCEIRDFYPE